MREWARNRERERGILIHSSAGSKNSPRTEAAVCLGRRAHAHPPPPPSLIGPQVVIRGRGGAAVHGKEEGGIPSPSPSTLLSLHPVAGRHAERLKTPSLILFPSHQTKARTPPARGTSSSSSETRKIRPSVHPSCSARCLCPRYALWSVWWYG